MRACVCVGGGGGGEEGVGNGIKKLRDFRLIVSEYSVDLWWLDTVPGRQLLSERGLYSEKKRMLEFGANSFGLE